MWSKLYWLWVPKAGGTSVWSALLTDRKRRRTRHVAHWDRSADVLTFQHCTGRQVVDALGSKRYEYLICAWCRHPLERLVSIYHAALQDRNPLYRHPSMVCDGSFPAYVDYVCSGALPGPETSHGTGYANPQTAWLYGADGKVIPDFVGRHEHFARDWAKLHGLLNVPCPPLPRANASIHGPWREYYDDTRASLAADYYRHDLERLGYAL